MPGVLDHSALDWAEGVGGREALFHRVQQNYAVLDEWAQKTPWIEWLADEDYRSPVSLCLRLVHPSTTDERETLCKSMADLLQVEGVAYDMFTMHDAPAGFRIWGGPTVETVDLFYLTLWMDWAFSVTTQKYQDPPQISSTFTSSEIVTGQPWKPYSSGALETSKAKGDSFGHA